MSKLNRFLIHLDCLLDTRLAVIQKLNAEAIPTIFEDGYHNRDIDVFTDINTVQFREEYAKRDVSILRNATPTHMLIHDLLKYVEDAIMDTLSMPLHTGFEVVINVYPYQLNKKECLDVSMCVKHYIDSLVPVRVISASPKQLTPNYLGEEYGTVFIYDFDEWANENMMALCKRQLREVMFLAPRLKKLTNEEADAQLEYLGYDKNEKVYMDTFDAIENTAKTICELKLIDTMSYSIARPLEVAKEDDVYIYSPRPRSIIL